MLNSLLPLKYLVVLIVYVDFIEMCVASKSSDLSIYMEGLIAVGLERVS